MKYYLDLGHEYLQKYCVIEIATIVFFCALTGLEIHWYFENLERLKLYDGAVLLGFNASSVAIIKHCLESINVDTKSKD